MFKKGDPSFSANYRPISLTSIGCKSIESIIRDALSVYLNNSNLITPAKCGFLANHSTGAQLLKCINDWSLAFKEGDCVDIAILILHAHLIVCLP